MEIVNYTLAVGSNRIPLMQGKKLARVATSQSSMQALAYGNASGQEIRLVVANYSYEPYTPVPVSDGDYLNVQISSASTLSIGYYD